MKSNRRGKAGEKRLSRREKAISMYQIPLSLMNNSLISTFLHKHRFQYINDEMDFLKSVPTSRWRYVAKEKVEPCFVYRKNPTSSEVMHYDMKNIVSYLVSNKETIESEYAMYQDSQKICDNNHTFAVIDFSFWNGKKVKPTALSLKVIPGIRVGDWFYHKEYHALKGQIQKYSLKDANQNLIKEYDSFEELVKQHFDFVGTKQTFEKIIDAKSKKK